MLALPWEKLAPVIVSILIIIAVALLREKSPAFSAIAATMPINIPLGMFIVYASAGDRTETMQNFTHNVFINMWPTMVFALVVLIVTRWGWGLVPSIAAGYVGWGVSFLILSYFRGGLGN
ncbi:MAG: hypothetical protein SNJ54_11215 [Anaerolineae bacterium]